MNQTMSKPKTAAALIEMFVRQAEERGRVRGGPDDYWRSIYLTARQADWFLSVYEREQVEQYGPKRPSPWGESSSLTVGDMRYTWARRLRDGSLQVEFQSLSAVQAREAARRAEIEAEDAAWEAQQREAGQ